MTNRKELLSQIASEHLSIPTLETRKSDSLDFHQVSVWAVEAALNAAFEAGRQTCDPQSLDIHGVLAERHQIAVVWSIDDVQEVRPDLTEEQSWQVLQQTRRRHDATLGISWETLECHAESLFGNAPETDNA